MNKPVESSVHKAVDSIQQRLTSYACSLNYDGLLPQAIHAAKVRVSEFITGVVLAYEIFMRISDVFHNQGFDQANVDVIPPDFVVG